MRDLEEADVSARRSRHEIPETDLYLERDGRRYPLAQLCDLWLIPRPGTAIPRGAAEVVSVIDGHADRWAIEIACDPASLDADDPKIPIRGMRLLVASEAA